jgi:hypothetical protein
MKRRMTLGALLFALTLATSPAFAKDLYYQVKLSELPLTEGSLPGPEEDRMMPWRLAQSLYPEVRVEGESEAYVSGVINYWNWDIDLRENGLVHVRAPAGEDVVGELRIPHLTSKEAGQERLKFRIPAKLAGKHKKAFQVARGAHYQRLMDMGIPGAAWFRHQRDLDRPEAKVEELTPEQRRQRRVDDLSNTYDLFSGGRALSENLQLDRVLLPRGGSKELVDVSTLEGITVTEIDWAPLLPAKDPMVDPLARFVPADQHALFFPTFSSMLQLSDEADGLGTPLLALFETRSTDSNVKGRYQTQLCLSMSGLSRLLGPKLVRSVAFTGSDPFLRMGSDVAILFDANGPELLMTHVRRKQATAALGLPPESVVSGKLATVAYEGVCNPDRRICSYLARHGDLVIVTNSLAQLKRLVETATGSREALGSLDEYSFFRHRYPLGNGDETAFLLLPDGAIRRWCSPQWRIADSRRVRAAAILARYQADHLAAMATLSAPEIKDSIVGPLLPATDGYLSKTWGTLSFMTPIIELDTQQVTEEEAEAYRWFRDRYQRNWRDYFDPIAIRFNVDSEELALDLSVMPLIANSDYREFIELTAGSEMGSYSGDPHPETLFRFGISLNPDSPPVRKASSFAISVAPGFSGNALSWLGDSVVIYGDQDRYWTDLVRADKKSDFLERNFHRLPVALRVAIASPMKATAFLASVRAFIEQTAPNMTLWETRKEGDLSYVRVGPAQRWDDDLPEDLALYYAIADGALTVTLNEKVLKRSLRRAAKRASSPAVAARMNERSDGWLGKQVGFQADGDLLELLELGAKDELLPEIQARSFGNLPILNEWHRLFPNEDPVAMHQDLWMVKLICPGGGEYRWNEEWQTMESTVYGHPGAPLSGPSVLRPPLSEFSFGNFGMTFADGGLRARATFYRGGAKRSPWYHRVVLHWLRRLPAAVRARGSLALDMAGYLGAVVTSGF